PALPDLSIRETGEEAALGDKQCVRHRRNRPRKPAGKLEPAAVVSTVDARLRITATVRSVRSRACRDVPDLGVVRVDRDRPGVVTVAALVGGMPCVPSVLTP